MMDIGTEKSVGDHEQEDGVDDSNLQETISDKDMTSSSHKDKLTLSENSKLLNQPAAADDYEPELPSPSRQRVMLAVLLSLQFLALSIDTLIVPFFPTLAETKGLNSIHNGIIFSGYEFVRFLTSPIYGSMITTHRAKRMCILGSFVVGLSCLTFGFARYTPETWFFTMCLTVRLLAGNGSSMLTIASTSILMKSTSYTSNTIMGLVEMVIGAGYSFGPGIGALMYKYAGVMSGCWLFGALVTAISLTLFWIIPPLELERNSHQQKEKPQTFLNLLKIPGVLLMFTSLAVLRFGAEANRSVIPKFLISHFHVELSTIGLMFLSWSIGYMLFCPIVSRLVDKGCVYTVIISAWCCKMTIFFLLAPSPLLDFIFHGKRYLMLPAVLMPVSNIIQTGAYIPPFQASLNLAILKGYDRNSIHTYGILNGMVNAGISLGSFSGPLFGGIMVEKFDYDVLTTTLGFIFMGMVVTIISYLVVMKVLGKPLKPPDNQNTKDGKDKESDIS